MNNAHKKVLFGNGKIILVVGAPKVDSVTRQEATGVLQLMMARGLSSVFKHFMKGGQEIKIRNSEFS